MIITFVYPVYFKSVVCAGLNELGDLLWGLSGSISMVIVACLSPVMGAIADLSGRKKDLLILFALSCIFLTSQLTWVGSGMVLWGMGLFIVANVFYQCGQVFYNAYLPELASPGEVGRLSGYGWASAYLGGIAMLLLSWPYLKIGDPESTRLVFFLTALFYLFFSLPAFVLLPATDRQAHGVAWTGYFSAGIRKVRDTLSHIGEYRQLARFLLAYFVYMEGVATVVYYTSIYARDTLGFSLAELLYFFLVLQTVGVCGAVGLGWLSDWIGPRITLLAILCCWTLVAVGVALVYSKALFWMVSMVGVICLGSIQAVSRSMISLMVSRAQEAEIFGFYGVSGKLSSAAGPLLFGTISFVSGSQRMAMLAVALLFLLGLLLLMRVEDPSPKGNR